MIIGLIGLGKMGAAMARRLAEQSFDVVGWDRNPEAIAAAEGRRFTAASNAAEVTAGAEAVLSIVTEDHGVLRLYGGVGGLLEPEIAGKLFIEMSTLQPSTVRKLALDVAARGGAFVEAPVLGSVPTVLEGKLLALAGGEADDVARARMVLGALTREVVHLGPVGSGAAMKLAANLTMAAYIQALSEALALGLSQGLQLPAMLGILQQTPTANAWLTGKLPALMGGDAPMTLDLRTLRKDVMSAVATGAGAGVPMPLAAGTLSSLSAAVATGWGGKDLAELPGFFREAMLQVYAEG